MARLFTLYSNGVIFTAENSTCFKRAALAILISELVFPLIQVGVTFAATMHNTVGERMIAIGLDKTSFETIIVGCTVMAISWVMDEGCKLKDEAELTI